MANLASLGTLAPVPTRLLNIFLSVLALLSMVGFMAGGLPLNAREVWSEERFAPPVRPELVYVRSFGGPGDQWLGAVRFNRGSVIASSSGLSVRITITNDGNVGHVNITGNTNILQEVPERWPDGGRLGRIQYGFNQVHPILQQPFLNGPGWQLWGWNHDQAKATEDMADSRVRHALLAPDRAIIAIGWTDGGNTSFRRDPRNMSEGLGARMGVGHGQTTGGGRGSSSWVFRVTPQGELTSAMVFRRDINGATWDDWGRILVFGSGVIGPRSGAFADYGDGAGVVMASRDFQNMLFRAHVAGTKPDGPRANGMAWGAAIDSASGLAAICGWVDGPIVNFDASADAAENTPRHGGDKDAFVAIIRLWSPEDYQKAKAAEAEAKSN